MIFCNFMGRIEKEKNTVSLMIRIFCEKHERNSTLCMDCQELEAYSHERLDRCRYGEGKSSCKRCPTHCYKPQMKRIICDVMRFSGPRMLLYAPMEAIRHLFCR